MHISVLEKHTGSFSIVNEHGQPLVEVEAFLSSLAIRGLSVLSIRAYAYDLLALYRWMTTEAKKTLEELYQSDLLDLISYERKRGVEPKSINRRLTTIRSFYCFCTGEKLEQKKGVTLPSAYYKGSGRDKQLGLFLLKRRSHRLLAVKEPKKLIEPLEAQQVRCFLQTLRRYRDIALVHLMLLCGLRSREVLAVEIQDISFEHKHIRVRGKGSKERILPLPDFVISSIQKYFKLERPVSCQHNVLFVVLQGKNSGKTMTPEGLRSLFRHRRQSTAKLANANPHRLRHTFGADMARHGVRLTTLQRLMGHSSPMMTLQYVNLSMADIADELRRATKEIQKRYEEI